MNRNPGLGTMRPEPCTLHPVPYTLYPTPCTLHPAPYTLYPTPCALHPPPWEMDVHIGHQQHEAVRHGEKVDEDKSEVRARQDVT
jgi:hypothetical protein